MEDIGIYLLLWGILGRDVVGILLQRLEIGVVATVGTIGHIAENIGKRIIGIRREDACDGYLGSVAPRPVGRDQIAGGGVGIEKDDLLQIIQRGIQPAPDVGRVAKRNVVTRLAGVGYLADLLHEERRAAQRRLFTAHIVQKMFLRRGDKRGGGYRRRAVGVDVEAIVDAGSKDGRQQ